MSKGGGGGSSGGGIFQPIQNLFNPTMPQAQAPQIIAAPITGDPNATAADGKKTQSAMDAAADEQRRARGRAATLLTGGQGAQGQAQISKKTLLGS